MNIYICRDIGIYVHRFFGSGNDFARILIVALKRRNLIIEKQVNEVVFLFAIYFLLLIYF